MKRSTPAFRVLFRQGDDQVKELRGGRDFRLDSPAISEFAGRRLPSRVTDLLRIAMSVYVIDRITKRHSPAVPDGWSRIFQVSLEVADPDFWNADLVHQTLANCVNTVSGDTWDFTFLAGRPCPSTPISPLLPLSGAVPDVICPYSGGLDSAAGLVRRLQERSGCLLLPVTVWHQSGHRRLVRQQLRSIGRHFDFGLPSLVVRAIMRQPAKLGEEENSQRSRAFLFTCVAGAVAAATGASAVETFESGIGAVNLPLQDWMVGSKATKSSHPHFLRLVSELVSLAADRQVDYRLPFLKLTKAQVVRSLAEHEDLRAIALATVSCEHYPLRDKKHKQCGVCVPCVFRRQALAVGGVSEPLDIYKYDIFDPGQVAWLLGESQSPQAALLKSMLHGQRSRQSLRQKLRPLRSFLLQAERLSELDDPGGLPGFFRRHLEGTKVVRQGESLDPFICLYRQYRDEWLQLATDRLPHLAELIAPQKVGAI